MNASIKPASTKVIPLHGMPHGPFTIFHAK